jgi:hypothetical protein
MKDSIVIALTLKICADLRSNPSIISAGFSMYRQPMVPGMETLP